MNGYPPPPTRRMWTHEPIPAASQNMGNPDTDASWTSTRSAPPRSAGSEPRRTAPSPDRDWRFHDAVRRAVTPPPAPPTRPSPRR